MNPDTFDEAPTRVGAGPVTVAIDGELAVFRAHECRNRLIEALASAAGASLAVDLSGVSEVDGAGVQLLVALIHDARVRGTPIEFVAPSEAVREAMGVAGLHVTELTSMSAAEESNP